jgi:hypothetical protein
LEAEGITFTGMFNSDVKTVVLYRSILVTISRIKYSNLPVITKNADIIAGYHIIRKLAFFRCVIGRILLDSLTYIVTIH